MIRSRGIAQFVMAAPGHFVPGAGMTTERLCVNPTGITSGNDLSNHSVGAGEHRVRHRNAKRLAVLCGASRRDLPKGAPYWASLNDSSSIT